jgi:hypothetical protein
MPPLPAPVEDRSPELAELLRAEPPAYLDELVRARVSDALTERRAELDSQPSEAAPRSLGSAEAWAYSCGFLALGAQVADGLARSIWRALLG